ncbi:MAG: DNA-binding response regulator, partial [Pseudomonadota bacterium]
NDYITKPFRFEELLARIKVQLRDRRLKSSSPNETMLIVDDLSLNLLTRQAWVGDRLVELSALTIVSGTAAPGWTGRTCARSST